MFAGGGLGGTRRGGPDVNIKHSGREDNDRERERYRMERERDDYSRRDFNNRGGDRGGGAAERRDRQRSRSPKIRERPRSRSRERKERKRRRSNDEPEYERRDSRRDREREKEKERKKSKRSRSRERKRDKRDKSRDKRDNKREKERKPEYGDIKIKEEPVDDGMAIDVANFPIHFTSISSAYFVLFYLMQELSRELNQISLFALLTLAKLFKMAHFIINML